MQTLLVSIFGGSGVVGAFKEANDVVASEQSIFSKNQDYKSFLHVEVNPYVPILRGYGCA